MACILALLFTGSAAFAASADLSVSKSASKTTPDVGSTIVFTVSVANHGPSSATGVELTDILTSGLEFKSSTATRGSYNATTGIWTIGTVPNGHTEVLTITVQVKTDASFTNKAEITDLDQTDPVSGNNKASVTIYPVEEADIAVEKSVDPATPFLGSSSTFTITVENKGRTGAVSVGLFDDLPGGLVYASKTVSQGSYSQITGLWSVGYLSQNQKATLKITVDVRALGFIENCAEVISDHNDPDDTNDKACAYVAAREQETFWQNFNMEASTVTALSCKAASGTGDHTVFAGTDGGGVFRSLDGGDNWYPAALQEKYVRDLLLTVNQRLFVATNGGGVYRSSNHGDSFTNVFSDSKGQSDLALSLAVNTFNPHGTPDVFVGTDSEGIFVTQNPDAPSPTWTNITKNLSGKTILALGIEEDGAGYNRDRVLAGTFGSGLWALSYTTSSFASSWINISGGVLNRLTVFAVAVDAHDNIYAGTSEGLFRSTDGGSSWTLVLDGVVETWDQPVAVRSLLIYHHNAKEYILAGTDGDFIYRARTSHPTDWTRFNGHTNPPDGTADGLQSRTVLSFAECSSVLYAGTMGGGAHRSHDNAEIWDQISHVSLQDGYRAIQALVYDHVKDRLFGGTAGFGVLMSDDLGGSFLNWTRVNSGLTNLWIHSLEVKRIGSKTMLFAGTWGGGVYRSDNGGEYWNFSGLKNRIVYDLDFDHSGILFAATDHGEVSRSTDNGLTWTDIGVAATAIWSLGIDPSSGAIYAGTFGAGIYKSDDGGYTWSETGLRSGYVYDYTFGYHPDTGVYGVFAATATGVLFSSNGGHSWSVFANNIGLTTMDSRAIAFAGHELIVGTWGGGLFTYDSGLDAWVRGGFPGHSIHMFAVDPVSGGVFITTDQGVYRKAGSTSTSSATDPDLPTTFELSQNYPNPFNPTTTIEMGLPEATDVRLVVYDVLGRTVAVLMDERRAAGRHSVAFDATGLSGGLYLYRLETPHRALEQTMLLVK